LKRFLAALAAFGFVIQLVSSVEWFRGIRNVVELGSAEDARDPEEHPPLSVVVPARNEERAVKESIESVLEGDYPGKLEVIAVNDRSTDRTGEILKRLGDEHRLYLLRGALGLRHELHRRTRQ